MWAIVPVKPFLHAKSRLASILSPPQRAGLSREFLGHALDVLSQVPAVERTLVISRDSEALALARERNAHTVTESGAPDLNAALRRATEVALTFGARGVVILPTDLPFLSPQDVEALISGSDTDTLMAIAPDRHEEGTNALFVRPPGVVTYAFGKHSFQQHLAQARQAGVRVSICRLAGMALDVDMPEDFHLYQAAAGSKPRRHEDTKT